MEFRTLRADEIDLRVGTVGDGYYTLLLYKDARCDMNILDEALGAENWQRDHKEVKGNLYGGVGIWDKDKEQWIWKWDCGVESNTEKEKGEASDSFKRACVNAGIGRELYTAPKIYINCETISDDGKHYKIKNFEDIKKSNSMRVKEIEYNTSKEITKLVIVDNKGVQVYPKTHEKQIEKPITVERHSFGDDISVECAECGKGITTKVAEYSAKKYGQPLCYDCQRKVGI